MMFYVHIIVSFVHTYSYTKRLTTPLCPQVAQLQDTPSLDTTWTMVKDLQSTNSNGVKLLNSQFFSSFPNLYLKKKTQSSNRGSKDRFNIFNIFLSQIRAPLHPVLEEVRFYLNPWKAANGWQKALKLPCLSMTGVTLTSLFSWQCCQKIL